MAFIKKNPSFTTIEEVVCSNTGMTKENLFEDKRKYHIDNLDKASDIILKEIKDGSLITVVADYDADGIDAAAIMVLLFRALGYENYKIRLPHRFSEGYGLSEKIVEEIESGLLITVDNGISAYDAIELAKSKGLRVVLTDHHLAPEDGRIPNADVVIDPNAIENSADFNGYCGAGIALKLAIEILGENHSIIPKMISLAAVATVADVMRLVDDNRNIVKQGLKNMASDLNCPVGLRALLVKYDKAYHISSKDIGFSIAPTINAPGRLFDDGAEKSLNLLVESDKAVAGALADELFEINENRKLLKDEAIVKIEENIKANCLFGDSPLIIYEPDIHEGLVGIVAGQMAEKYHTPCFVFTNANEEGVIKGSARSFGGVNIKELLDGHKDLLIKHGGHAEAAGVSLLLDNLDDLRYNLSNDIPEIIVDENTQYDLEIEATDIPTILKQLEVFAPYGEGNPMPVFLIKNYQLSPNYGNFYKVMGKNNNVLKLFGKESTAIGFNVVDKYAEIGSPKHLTLVGSLSYNYFMGKVTNQVELVDFDERDTGSKQTPMAAMLADMAKNRK